jgi:Tol biopolymer transport system component
MRMRKSVLLLASLVIAVLSVSAVALVGVKKPAEATMPGANGKIAFASNRDGNYEIYTMNADGSGLVNLTNHPADDRSPAFSPDGTRIAFTSNREGTYEIYTMNADGSNVTRLTNNSQVGLGGLSWSPDGTRMAFSGRRPSPPESAGYPLPQNEIIVMNADGSNQTNITNTPQNETSPAWSPDGTRIAFTHSNELGFSAELYTMSPDGSNVTRLTNNSNEDFDPDWSPDGSKIVFVRIPTEFEPAEIFVMNADGSNQIQLTSTDAGLDLDPAWSPDGTKIVFSRYRCSDERGCEWGIYTMSADGSDQTSLTINAIPDSSDLDPDWQPLPHAYDFSGFFSPVNDLPTLNSMKAGRAVPVKFSLDGDQGLDIFAEGYPVSHQIDCDSTTQVDSIEQTVTAGESSLSYDAITDQYTYTWKSDKTWAGTCRQFTMKLDDGTVHQANFKFR